MFDVLPAAWFRALLYQQHCGNQALTLPLLLAILRFSRGLPPDGAVPRGEFAELLRTMRDEIPEGYVVRISECGRLSQPVATAIQRQQYYFAEADYAVPGQHGRQPALIVEPRPSFGSSSDLAGIQNALWSLLEEPLSEGRLSFRNHAYFTLEQVDLDFIESAIGYDPCHEV
jgi:hypothetical protein